ncbi:protein MNN4-like [Papaver somniferum]|uniref:protein MNN4-like n=1 Tax=Papaver somniferum TaxID=3469 RepID=UPI000E6FCB7F|nr:protein MNN4-like [Papaver somniferum]
MFRLVLPFQQSTIKKKNIAFSLRDIELERLRYEIQEEINRRPEELALHQKEEEERKRREKEEVEALYVACKIKHFDRVDRKDEERSQKAEKSKGYGSATESDSDAEGSDNGYDYPVDEVDTSEEGSDAAEEKEMMKRYHERKLRMRFEDDKYNPRIFSQTMREGESSDDDEELLDASSDEDDDNENSDESTSSGDSQVSPASSDRDYSAQYEE